MSSGGIPLRGRVAPEPERCGERPREGLDRARPEREPVVGDGARRRRRALDHVEAIHLGTVGAWPTAGREGAGVTKVPGTAAEEVGVECEEHVRVLDLVARLDGLAEGEASAGPRVVAPHRLVLVPLRGREGREKRAELAGEGGGGDGLGEHPEPRAFPRTLGLDDPAYLGQERAPRADPPGLGDGLGAVGVVERQDGSLCEGVGRTQAGGMVRVALDLGRAAHVALDEDAGREPAERKGGGEEERLARHEFLGRSHVGDDRLGGRPAARAQAGECERRAHEAQELAAVDGVEEPRRVTRELLRQERGRSRSLGQLLEGVPVRRAPQRRQASPESRERPAVPSFRHRWQTEQLVMLAIP